MSGSGATAHEVTMLVELRARHEELVIALRRIRDFDAFQGSPIAPRETPTTEAMRAIARKALENDAHS